VEGWQPADTSAIGATGATGYALAVSDPAQAAPAVARALVAAGADVLSIAESRHTLEDVYLELVNDEEGRS
jgi:ABC-2 type transport system ATP-binding protein